MKKENAQNMQSTHGVSSVNGTGGRHTRRSYAVHFSILAVLCMLLVVTMFFYSDSLENHLYADSVEKLGDISEQNVKVLNTTINGQIESLNEVAARIAVPTNWDIAYTIYTLNKVMENYPFKRMGIIFTDGSSYYTDGKTYNMSDSDMESMRTAFEGSPLITGPFEDPLGSGYIISLQVPVYKGNEINAVLAASYETDVLQEVLNVSFFGGQGYSYIVHANGNIVADSSFPTSFKDTRNIFDSINAADISNKAAADGMRKNMGFNENGYIMFRNKVNKYMYYSYVGINDWYLMSVIPSSVIDSTRRDIMIITYLLCAVIGGIFLVIVMFFTRLERGKRKELQDIIFVDPLTQGYSFQRFCKEARERLKADNRPAAVIGMDIEKFKIINEMFGYEEGDKVLRYVWSTISDWIQDGEIFCRRSADKFTVLAFFENDGELIKRLDSLASEIMSDRTERWNGFVLRLAIGIYRVTDRNLEIATMQNNASMARTAVKNSSGTQLIGFYDESYKTDILNNKLLEDRLIAALEKKEFEVFYQPKYSTGTKTLVGAEALIRWRNSDGTYIPPYKFIPAAEKNGFVVNLDKYVFKRVCDDQRERINAGKKLVPVSVNLSRQHMYTPRFIDDYRRIIERSGVPIEMIELEITESAMFENQGEFSDIIDRLHEVGFKILMDDFGTGYSSLMMLKAIPIDVMKLDKSFVDDYNDDKGEKIIACVTQLAKSLRIEVTAEGVETEEQYQFMKRLGCDAIQGYYFAKPMPREKFDALLTCIE